MYLSNKISNKLRQHIDVTSALIYKELSTRLGTSNIVYGVFGIFVEPLGIIVILLLIRVVLRDRTYSDINLVFFVIAGVIPFYAFKDIAVRSLKSMKQNEPILIYKPVQPAGIVVARSTVELGIYSILYAIISFGVMAWSEKWLIHDFPLLLFAYFLLFLFSLGVGLIAIVVGHLYPLVNKIVPFLMRPLLFVSGIFIPLSAIPQNLRPALAFNPILQSIEISRHAISEAYMLDDLISLNYLISVSFMVFSFGIMVSILTKKRLMKQ
mgnify:CR=1 FL=1